MHCVCVCVFSICAFSAHKLVRFLSVVSLSGCVQHFSFFSWFVVLHSLREFCSREFTLPRSTSVGVNVFWITPLGNSFSGVCARPCALALVQDKPRASFTFESSFMQGDPSQRTPSVQPEGWISNALLKPLLGNCAYTHARLHTHTRTYTKD